MKPVGVVRFLGTNCDLDVFKALKSSSAEPRWLWFSDRFEPRDFSAVVIPGGFSHGDYLRAGALAARQPVMQDVRAASEHGIPVLGICNGMQILCESGLLPGAMVKNEDLRFKDLWVELELANPSKFWARRARPEQTLRLPIAHGEGRFYADSELLAKIEGEGQVWWRYKGEAPNGSLGRIAGLKSASVAALMPHPERAMAEWMGSSDGQFFFAELGG